jgi:hypothetical protein
MKMEGDISLFLAIDKMMQERMFLHQGKLFVKDANLATIYDVKLTNLRTKINKNISRFPSDFMIETSKGEYALTVPGILMLGGLLRSNRARRAHMQFIGKNGQNDHLRPEQIDHPFAGAN